jgi:hypothetical protein
MHKFPAAAYVTLATLAIVTIIGVNHTQTATTGSASVAQAMFTDEVTAAQQLLDNSQIAHRDSESQPNNLH